MVLPWQRKKLLGNVDVNITNHWNDVYISDEDEPEEKNEKITPGKHDVLKRANEKQQHQSYQPPPQERDEKITPDKHYVHKRGSEKQQHPPKICPEVTPNKPTTCYGQSSLPNKSHLF